MRFRRLSRFLGHVPRKHLNEITILVLAAILFCSVAPCR
jgi:hypothetical protein